MFLVGAAVVALLGAQCYRWTSGPKDPYRKVRDPAAGVWFGAMARELADNAVPPLR